MKKNYKILFNFFEKISQRCIFTSRWSVNDAASQEDMKNMFLDFKGHIYDCVGMSLDLILGLK